jgi:phosphoglycolate phosphatase
MRAYDTVLFDLDGTISDPAPGFVRSMQDALAQAGVPDPGRLERFLGPPLADSFRVLGVADVDGAIAAYRARYNTIGYRENTLYDGVPELLDALLDAGYTLALATSKPEGIARAVLEHFELIDRFHFVGAATADGTRSHKDQVIAHTLGHLPHHDPARTVMVGDREHDVLGAHRCGLDVIAVTWGFGERQELDAAAPTHVVGSPAQLARHLLG